MSTESKLYEIPVAKSYEIAPGITAEEMAAIFFDEKALVEQPQRVYRLHTNGKRFYYTFDEKGEPTFYVSVTTFIKQTLPTDPQLIKWIASKGYDESKAFAEERANYGTFMHAQIADLLINQYYDLDLMKERLKMYIESEKLPSEFINYADDLKKDILAFAQFMIDTNLKPLAIEIILVSPEDKYGGALDLACELDIEEKGYFGEVYKTGVNAGQPKESKRVNRIRAIIDFKSGRKGFFEEHEIQLHAYKKMWNQQFPKHPVERVFNWSPKDWRGKVPTYNFKDQSNSENASKLPYLVELSKIMNANRENVVVSCNGVINIGKVKTLESNIMEIPLSEIVKRKVVEDKPEETPELTSDELGLDNHSEMAFPESNAEATEDFQPDGQGNEPETEKAPENAPEEAKKLPEQLIPGVDF